MAGRGAGHIQIGDHGRDSDTGARGTSRHMAQEVGED